MSEIARRVVPIFLFLMLVMHSFGAQSYCNGGVVQGNAPWYCNQINQALAKYWVTWLPIAFLAVIVSLSIANLIFAAGILMRNERIRNFGIAEYYEAFASALIVIGFLFITAVMFGLIPGIVTGPINPYDTALTYINNTASAVSSSVTQLFQIAVLDRFYISITFSFCSYNVGSVNCHVLPNVFSYILNWLVYVPAFTLIDIQLDAIAIIYAEFWIILLFMYMAIPVFLIPGVVLRTILPTRGLGGMMMAAAIGFYVVMPVLFSVAYYFTNTTLISQINSQTAALQTYGAGVGAQTNALTPTSPLVETLNDMRTSMGAYWLSILFYPTLIMALTYAIILQIAEFIGGMAQLSGRMRL